MSQKTRTCGHCQKETRADDNACYHCHYLRRPETFAQKVSPSLAPAPRRVPLLLPLVYALRANTVPVGVAVALLSVAVAVVTGAVEAWFLLLLLPVMWSYRFLRAWRVLRTGVVAPAKVIRQHNPFGLEGNVVMAKGWELQPTSYNGSSSREVLVLQDGYGPEAIFRSGGLTGSVPYSGGFFIFDPDNPEKRVSVKDFPLVEDMHGSWSAVRPDAEGNYQVRGKVVVYATICVLLAGATFLVPMVLVLSFL